MRFAEPANTLCFQIFLFFIIKQLFQGPTRVSANNRFLQIVIFLPFGKSLCRGIDGATTSLYGIIRISNSFYDRGLFAVLTITYQFSNVELHFLSSGGDRPISADLFTAILQPHWKLRAVLRRQLAQRIEIWRGIPRLNRAIFPINEDFSLICRRWLRSWNRGFIRLCEGCRTLGVAMTRCDVEIVFCSCNSLLRRSNFRVWSPSVSMGDVWE